MVHEGATLVVEAPEFARNEFAIPCKKAGRPSRLILVERLAFGIGLRVAGSADVVHLEIGVSGHHDHVAPRTQTRSRQGIARQIDEERWSTHGIVHRPELQVRRIRAERGVVGARLEIDLAWLSREASQVAVLSC